MGTRMMVQYTVRIGSLENAAFEDYGVEFELARILRDLADRMEHDAINDGSTGLGMSRKMIFDMNGNCVGSAGLERVTEQD